MTNRRVRITSGEFGGRFIETAPTLRATADLVRKALFDILGDLVLDKTFLDLFAGSGSVGFEALSHGAAQATFIEKNREHFQLIKKNALTLRVVDRCIIRQMDVSAFIEANQTAYDIIFADPWYEEPLDISGWTSPNLLAPDGMIIVEQNKHSKLITGEGLRVLNQKRYGDTTLTFFVRA
jgi:16S rRNA (guanine966-N2)-methyltransferase